MSALGMELVSVDKESVVMTMPVDERTRQPVGFLHGGASVALAETAASVGAGTPAQTETEAVLRIATNASNSKSRREGCAPGRATPLQAGCRDIVMKVNLTDEDRRWVWFSRCTISV